MKFPGKHIKEETPMINKLIANIKKTGAPIVVGLDPMLNYIPKQIQEAAFKEFGETLQFPSSFKPSGRPFSKASSR